MSIKKKFALVLLRFLTIYKNNLREIFYSTFNGTLAIKIENRIIIYFKQSINYRDTKKTYIVVKSID